MTKEDYVIICGDFGGVWNKEVEEAREEAEKAPETLKLAAVFEKDPAGRIAAAGDILNQWKMEYRRML